MTGSEIGIALITSLESLQANEYLLSDRQNALRKNMQLKHVKVRKIWQFAFCLRTRHQENLSVIAFLPWILTRIAQATLFYYTDCFLVCKCGIILPSLPYTEDNGAWRPQNFIAWKGTATST